MPRLNVHKWGIPLLFLASSGAVLLEQAAARPPYRTQAIAQFHLEADPAKKGTTGCTYCHVNARGGAPWNAFGQTVKRAFSENPRAFIPDALYGALKFDLDSDKDGYSDALEVFALTLPGDATSKPSESVADLQKRFDAAGGVEQYNPTNPAGKPAAKPVDKPATPTIPTPSDMTPVTPPADPLKS